jgi:hypothetical protein
MRSFAGASVPFEMRAASDTRHVWAPGQGGVQPHPARHVRLWRHLTLRRFPTHLSRATIGGGDKDVVASAGRPICAYLAEAQLPLSLPHVWPFQCAIEFSRCL